MRDPDKPTDRTRLPGASRATKTLSESNTTTLSFKHLRWGWWSLLVFLCLGMLLEVLHGFKVGTYLNVSAAPRRLMWTLAHAHGTLLALVHLAFAASLPQAPQWAGPSRANASACLLAAGVLLPAGFFLGGLFTRGGDPGLGILLVPFGGLLLLLGVLSTARQFRSR